MKTPWKKGIAILLTAGLACGQMGLLPVNAQEEAEWGDPSPSFAVSVDPIAEDIWAYADPETGFREMIQRFGSFYPDKYYVTPILDAAPEYAEADGSEYDSYDLKTVIVETDSLAEEDLGYLDFMLGDAYVLSFDSEAQAAEILAKYEDLDGAEAYYDAALELFDTGSPYYPYVSWGPEVIGTQAMKDVLLAEYGSVAALPQVRVGLLDSGINYYHSMLTGRIQGHAYDFYDNDSDALDERGHGSQVAGIVADMTLPNVQLHAYKITNAEGKTSASRLAAAINQAVLDGVSIINMSLGGEMKYDTTDPSKPTKSIQNVYDALDKAASAGILLVIAAGNSGIDISKVYPANYKTYTSVGVGNTLVVSALNRPGDTIASYSDFGAIDISAPGSSILSSYFPGSSNSSTSGTSMAAPFVTGAAAMVKTRNPGMSAAAIKNFLLESARDLGSAGYDSYYGYGRVDINPYTDTPVIETAGGEYHSAVNVSISVEDPSAQIYYTIDGSDPKTSVSGSTMLYQGTFSLSSSKMVKALAIRKGKEASPVVSARFYINQAPISSDFMVDGSGTILAYHGEQTELVIPEQLDGKPIQGIASYSFRDAEKLTKVTIPASIQKIGMVAFYCPSGLDVYLKGNPQMDEYPFGFHATIHYADASVDTLKLQNLDYEVELFDHDEHDFAEEIILAPTCTEPGKAQNICTVCGMVEEGSEKELPPTGHHFVITETIEPEEDPVGFEAFQDSVLRKPLLAGGLIPEEAMLFEELALAVLTADLEEPETLMDDTLEEPDLSYETTEIPEEMPVPSEEITEDVIWEQEETESYEPVSMEPEETAAEVPDESEEPVVVEEPVVMEEPTAAEEPLESGDSEEPNPAMEEPTTGEETPETDGMDITDVSRSHHGWIQYTCTECGAIYYELLSPEGHTVEVTETIPATLESPERTWYHCSVEGCPLEDEWADGMITAPALGPVSTEPESEEQETEEADEEAVLLEDEKHVLVFTPAIPATCQNTGMTESVACSDCGKVFLPGREIPKLSHTPKVVEGTSQTCFAAGSSRGVVCSVCGESLIAPFSVEPMPHYPITIQPTAGTCETRGLSMGKYCKACNQVLLEQKAVYGHKLNYFEAIPATYDQKGRDAYWACTVCKKFFSDELGEHEIAAESWILGYREPNPVQLSSVTAISNGIEVKWKAGEGASFYYIYRKTAGEDWQPIATVTGNAYTDTTALPLKTYSYTVQGYNKNSELWSAYDLQGKSAYWFQTPKKPTVTISGGKALVKWNKVPEAAGYRIFRKASGDTKWTIVGTVTGQQITDAGIQPGVLYYYAVKAYRSVGGVTYWSGYEAPGSKAIYLDTPVITSVSPANTGLKVTWKSVKGADGYRIYRKPEGSGEWKMVVTSQKGTTFTDGSITSGKAYSYRVRAYTRASGTLEWSASSSAAVTGYWLSMPEPTVTLSNGTAVIKWNKVSGASGYRIFRKKAGDSKWTILGTVTGLQQKDTGLEAGVLYYYTVKAYATYNRSTVWSSYLTPGITGIYLEPVKQLQVLSAPDGIKLSWEKVKGADGYRIYRKAKGETGWTMLVASQKGTSYLDSNAKAGKNDYLIRAFSRASGSLIWSPYDASTAVSVTR